MAVVKENAGQVVGFRRRYSGKALPISSERVQQNAQGALCHFQPFGSLCDAGAANRDGSDNLPLLTR